MSIPHVGRGDTAGAEPRAQQWSNLVPVIGLLLMTALVAVGGTFEGGSHSIDDLVITLLAVTGIVWSVPSANRHSRSLVPLGLVAGALVMQLLALLIERGDTGDLGDDTLGVVILAVVLVLSGLAHLAVQPRRTATEPTGGSALGRAERRRPAVSAIVAKTTSRPALVREQARWVTFGFQAGVRRGDEADDDQPAPRDEFGAAI